jgi:hypothetical protein
MSNHILPDGRLHNRKFGAVIGDWELPDGTTVRIEMSPVYCQCGKLYGYTPTDNCSFSFWLCNKCYEKYGAIAGTYAVPDDEFNLKLQEEMVARFGREVTAEEIAVAESEGRLGRPLELLTQESPYKLPS